MQSTFDKPTSDKLIARIRLLNESSTAQWGKMNVYQMIKHCTLWEQMVLGNKTHKQVFIGRLFGKMALRSLLKDDNPLKRNSPTIPDLIISETSGDIADEKMRWIALLEKYEHFTNENFIHPFYGKMTQEQIGYVAYKHNDHHLRQFGV